MPRWRPRQWWFLENNGFSSILISEWEGGWLACWSYGFPISCLLFARATTTNTCRVLHLQWCKYLFTSYSKLYLMMENVAESMNYVLTDIQVWWKDEHAKEELFTKTAWRAAKTLFVIRLPGRISPGVFFSSPPPSFLPSFVGKWEDFLEKLFADKTDDWGWSWAQNKAGISPSFSSYEEQFNLFSDGDTHTTIYFAKVSCKK